MALHTMQHVLTLPVSDRDHIQGLATAKVTLVEYGDYQCPYCLQAYPIMLDIQQHMGDRMRLVFRNYPRTALHPDAQDAAEAAEAAGAQGKFWPMHDYLFEHQSRLNHESLLGYGADIGLDVPRFRRDMETHAFAPRVREDLLSGVQSGVTDTPTFFINGLLHGGPWNLETLTAAIVAAVERR